MDLDFDHEEHETGGSKRPTKIVLKGIHPETGDQVGHLTYYVPRRKADKILVDRLEVEPHHKGKGYAGQLMDEMQARHPGTPIDHGDRTDEGKNWWASYTRGKSVSKGRTIASRAAARADDGLDDAQRHALKRLDGMDELIQGHDARELMREHNIHLHDEDPYEAGEVGDDHMVPRHEGGSVHHNALVPLHTSQDTLYKSGLEHYIRHGYSGGGGIGPKDRQGEPYTWEHEGQHWIGGGHHRILADRMTYGNGTVVRDVTNRSRLDFKQAAEMPPAYPNPRAEFREGGPDGTHWYHGTDEHFSGPLKPTERDYGHASTDDTHWNTDLGVHFTSSHDLARSFARNFAGTDSATPEHARIAHATLHMRNPADFENEHDLADHAIRTARRHGLRYGETDDPELQDVNDGHEDEVSLVKKDHWLSSHPHREQIVGHVEHDLKKAGHDGIVYGNSYEGSPGDKSAIAFRDTPVAIHRWEHLHPQHPEHGRTAARKPTLLYHGTAADEDPERIEPGPDGYAYATKSPLHALRHAQVSAASGGEPHVYEVKHLGRPADLDEHPGEQHAWRSTKGFQVLRRSPIGLAPRPANEKEAHVREAGKGKPRRDAPDVDRRAQEAAGGGLGDVAQDSGGNADGALKALVEHPRVGSDLKKLPKQIQAAYRSRVDGLRRGSPHSSTHALSGPLKGWQATSLNFQYRVVHRHVGDELHVLSAGNHDESYDQGARRTAVLERGVDDVRETPWHRPYGPTGFRDRPVVSLPIAGLRRTQGPADTASPAPDSGEPVHVVRHRGVDWLYDGHHRVTRAAERGETHVPARVLDLDGRTARYTPPRERLFGRTYGLDKRLWDGETLKEPVRADILATFAAFCARHGLVGHEVWAKVVFFGSEASEWTSEDLTGNNDFDLSVGVQYDLFRSHNRSFANTPDAGIADSLTKIMHVELNDPKKQFPGSVEGTWDQTWFANLLGWSIELIRPYAAWDVAAEEWIVRPPSLPDWSIKDFPEGPGLAEEIKGIVGMAEGILRMPEPYRTQNGSALWEFVHSNRSDAFGPDGEGWWDARNAVEKALDQKGLMQRLFECHRRAAEHPESLAAPADWSNSPA